MPFSIRFFSFLLSMVLSHAVVSDSLWLHGLQPARLLYPWNFPGKNTWVGFHFLLLAAVNKTTYYIHFPLPQTALTFLMNFWRTCLSPHRRGTLVLSVLSTHPQSMGKETQWMSFPQMACWETKNLRTSTNDCSHEVWQILKPPVSLLLFLLGSLPPPICPYFSLYC